MQVTVLPPGEWDPQIRLEPPKQVPSQAERRLKPKDLEKQKEEEEAPAIECTKMYVAVSLCMEDGSKL